MEKKTPGSNPESMLPPEISEAASLSEIKSAIWEITNDVEYIKLVKRDIGFINGVEKELDPQRCYWHLYQQIRKNFIHHKHAPIKN